MNERIYRPNLATPYQSDVSHYPNAVARLSERLISDMAFAASYSHLHPADQAKVACDVAEAMLKEWEKREWLLPVEEAPK